MQSLLKWFFLFLILLSPQIAEAKRLPSPHKIQSVTQKFFHKYGKRYPETEFGQKNLHTVQINSVREVSYNVAYADLVLVFKDQKQSRSLVRMTKKFPHGWHVASWEILKREG